jgi:hypothetical protein
VVSEIASLGRASGHCAGSQQDFVVNVADRVYCDTDPSDIRADAQGTFFVPAASRLRYPAVLVRIEGIADERGTRKYNYALGGVELSPSRTFWSGRACHFCGSPRFRTARKARSIQARTNRLGLKIATLRWQSCSARSRAEAVVGASATASQKPSLAGGSGCEFSRQFSEKAVQTNDYPCRFYRGSFAVNVVPSASDDVTLISPPCATMISFVM